MNFRLNKFYLFLIIVLLAGIILARLQREDKGGEGTSSKDDIALISEEVKKIDPEDCDFLAKKINEQKKEDCIKESSSVGLYDVIKRSLPYINVAIKYKDYLINGGMIDQGLILKNLLCSMNGENEDKNFEMANIVIEKFSNNPGNDFALSWINGMRSGRISKNNFYTFALYFALEERDKMCPDNLNDYCLYTINDIGLSDKIEISDWCNSLCGTIFEYENDPSLLASSSIPVVSAEQEAVLKTALSYQVGGKDSAVKFCNNLGNEDKIMCLPFLDLLELQSYDCPRSEEELKEFMCFFESLE